MEHLGKESIPISNFCEWCFAVGTSRCGRCHGAYYCCPEHQYQHWPIHKKVCKKTSVPQLTLPVNTNSPSTSTESFEAFSSYDLSQNNISSTKNEINNPMIPTNVFVPNDANVQKTQDFNIPSEDEIFSSLSSELLSSDNNFWDLIDTCDTQNISDCNMYLERNVKQLTLSQDQNFVPYPHANENNSTFTAGIDMMQCAPLNDICETIVNDLNTFGICVLDKFIGANYGNLILQEVKNLYLTGIFKKGEIVNPNPFASKESVRCDVTTWVNGTEPGCKHIGNLIRKLDVVVTTCNKMQNNGLLSKYKLHRRTKAMIACYPGDGTYYKKHVDNPHKDGRCITCIYYLNQNWDTETHGGLLRMFPLAHDSHVANIDPIFDRMLFFWSDKRNPHEVLPAFATRFAITVWYFDADERDQALMMSRERAFKSRNQHFIS